MLKETGKNILYFAVKSQYKNRKQEEEKSYFYQSIGWGLET